MRTVEYVYHKLYEELNVMVESAYREWKDGGNDWDGTSRMRWELISVARDAAGIAMRKEVARQIRAL